MERDWRMPRFAFIGVDWERKRGAAVLEARSEQFASAPPPRRPSTWSAGTRPSTRPGVTGHGVLSLRDPADRRLHAELLARATCLVLPSSFEAFGIAYLDAGAAGVPSIGTTVGGAPDAIGDGGIVVDL